MMKRLIFVLLLCVVAAPAFGATGLGDFPVAATVYCPWTSNAQTGASITRSTNGTVSVYHSANLTQSTTGVTDGEDHDSLTGVHMVTIDTSADGTFYAAGREFSVILAAATIDTLTVNSVLCTFSLERTNGALAMLKARTPAAAAGASGGLLISGSNTGTTTLGALTVTGATTLTGAVTAAAGIAVTNSTTNGHGLTVTGNGTGAGLNVAAGATGVGVKVATTSGDGISVTPTAGSGLVLTANGTSKHGAVITGGTAGTSDGFKLVAGTGGTDMRANITGSLSGSVGSVAATSGGTLVMPEAAYVKASTSVIHEIFIRDSATGLGKTGLDDGSAGLAISYSRSDQGGVAQTCAPANSAVGAYTSCGFVEKDASLLPGVYQVGLTTAMLATGSDWANVSVSGVSGTVPTLQPIALVDTGLAALNTKIGTPAGASVSADIAAEALKTIAIKGKTDSLNFTGTNVNAEVAAYSSGQAPLQPTVAGRTLDVTATGAAGIDWANVENPTTALNLSGTNIDVDQVTASVGSVTGAVGSVTAGVTVTTNNDKTGYTASTVSDKTGYGLAANAVDSTSVAATGADKIGDDVQTRFPTNFAAALFSTAGVNTAGGTYRKNVASQVYPIYLVDSSGDAVTGASVTVKMSKDGATGVTIAGSVAETDATNLPGWYLVSFTQADTNCSVCYFKATAAGVVPRAFYFTTAP